MMTEEQLLTAVLGAYRMAVAGEDSEAVCDCAQAALAAVLAAEDEDIVQGSAKAGRTILADALRWLLSRPN